VWSVGVLLYEMIAGRHPFPGADATHRDPEPLMAWRSGIPQDLEKTIARAMARRAEDRYPGAAELGADLGRIADRGYLSRVGGTVLAMPSRPAEPFPRSRSEEGQDLPRPAILLGQSVGHYVIREHFGGGGMGVIYKAEDVRLERLVALKFLPPELTRDPVAKARFHQEARAASALEHPNICTIFEVNETEDGQLYLAMPAYDGEILKKKIERGPLPVSEAIDIAIQVGQGLAKAHRQGIIHRDIKPANVIVTDDGVVKILDFGLAKLAGAAGLTRAGFCLGTPSYMSPEQARGEVDPRTDLWSLGVVLYEMVAGRPPFRADTDQGIIYALLTEEPEPLRKLRPEAPPELEDVLRGMLAKSPEARYPNLDAVLLDLRQLASVTSTFTRVSMRMPPLRRPWWRAPAVAGLAALALVAALLLARAMGWIGIGPKPLQRTNEPLTDLEGFETHPSLSPDGSFFLFVKESEGDQDIFWQRVGGGNPRNLTEDSPADDGQPAVSPDGQRIAFRSERAGGGLYLMGSTGESVVRLTGEGHDPAWSPDGKWIVYATEGIIDPRRRSIHRSDLWRVRVADSTREQIAMAEDAVQPSWSPNGHRIAFWGLRAGTGTRMIWTIPAGGGEAVAVTDGRSIDWNPVWSPDGSFLYFVSDRSRSMTLWRVPIDERSGQPRGEPQDLTTPAAWSGFLSIARDGRQIAYATRDGKANLERVAFDPVAGRVSGVPEAVTQGSRLVRFADASPDGKWIVYDTALPQEDLFVIGTDGQHLRQLTEDPERDRVPRWSPDGQRILFYSDRGGEGYQAWSIRADGGDRRQLTAIRGGAVLDALWAPDARRLLVLVDQGPALIDLSQPLAQRRPQPLPKAIQGDRTFMPSAWSPDGRWLAGEIQSTEARLGIARYSLESARIERLTDSGMLPVWLPDGRILYLKAGKVFLLDPGTRQTRAVLTPPPNTSSAYVGIAVTKDGRLLFPLRASDEGDVKLLRLQ
jgi:eukaryotic-like serine/threonine-protein kinase